MVALVTGADGFIGAWLAEALKERGYRVIAYVRSLSALDSGAHWVVIGDVRDVDRLTEVIRKYRVNYVLHLAAQSIVPVAHDIPFITYDTNVRGTLAVLEACRRAGGVTSVVAASTDKVYGEAVHPYREGDALSGYAPYEASKVCADILAHSYGKTYDLPIRVVRCGNVYGGGDFQWSRIIPGTILAYLEGRRPIIRSDGTPVREYVYVKDVVDAYIRIAEWNGEGVQAFNIGSGEAISVLDLVRKIQRIMGATAEPQVMGGAKSELHYQRLDYSKIRGLLGWQPKYTLDVGLKETIKWYRTWHTLKG